MKPFAILLALLLPSVAAAEPPNIVFVMADDLGYGHLGSYGQTKIKTPHIDRLAAEGMRFTQAYAGSTVCAPSRSVLMTGLHGGHTPVRGNLGDAHLQDSDVTLAEILKSAGYATGAYGKWGLGLLDSPGHPLRQGFDDFLGYLHQVHAHFFYPFWLTLNHGRMNLPLNEHGGRGQYSHDLLFERALEFVRKHREGPFFCYLPVTIPHVELAVPADSLAEYLGQFPEVGGGQERRIGYIVSPNPRATYAANGIASRPRCWPDAGAAREPWHRRRDHRDLQFGQRRTIPFRRERGLLRSLGRLARIQGIDVRRRAEGASDREMAGPGEGRDGQRPRDVLPGHDADIRRACRGRAAPHRWDLGSSPR